MLRPDSAQAIAANQLASAGLPDFVYADGPNGVRDADGATVFPSGLALAASFDLDLASEFGRALAREALQAGRNAMLAPGLDIARVPWAGRCAEALGEDPYLVGEVGGNIAAGIQAGGVLAMAKHFVANNFERFRTGSGSVRRRSPAVDVRVSPRALRSIYLEPFRRVLVKYGAGSVMMSYNRVNGEYAAQNPELYELLRSDWGWQGITVPDFLFAVRDDEKALRAGLDLPALGGQAGRTAEMIERLDAGVVEAIGSRVVSVVERIQLQAAQESSEPLDDASSQDLAQRILEAGAVLLKNDDLLPVKQPRTLALVGIEDPAHLIAMGGSASVTLSPERIASLSGALAAAMPGAELIIEPGTLGDVPLPTLSGDVDLLLTDLTSGATRQERLAAWELDPGSDAAEEWSAVLSGQFTPEESGLHLWTVEFAGRSRLFINDELVCDGFREASPMVRGPKYPLSAVRDHVSGIPVDVRLEYDTDASITDPHIPLRAHVQLGVQPVSARHRAAARAAAAADVAIAVVGRVTGEAMDADSLSLPADQEQLIAVLAEANPRLLVVVCGSGPVVMPWIESVASVLHLWNPGERFAEGLTRILTGAVEPTGRLPLTFPVSEEKTPVSDQHRYPGVNGQADYEEELLVGYRWYDASGTEPLFAFGHGLGYTTFDLSGAAVKCTSDGLTVDFQLTNVGPRSGTSIVQLYVTAPDSASLPPLELAGFVRRTLEEGASEHVTYTIPFDDLERYTDDGDRLLFDGEYTVHVGFSSRDVKASLSVSIGGGHS